MPALGVGDNAVSYEDYGSGPVLLLLHGSPGNSKAWLRVGERLSDRYRVIAPDLPGYGATTPQSSGAVPDTNYAAELIEALVASIGPPTALAGHSYGGVVALSVALHQRFPIDLSKGKNVSYIEESLSTGERVEGLFKLHWFAWAPMVMWIVLGIPTLGLTWFIALYEYLKLRFLEQGVTNKRVILKRGIISRKTEEMKLTSIETVEIDQGIFGRMFGFGTVKITGRGISDFVFKGIADPISVKRRIESVGNPAA